MFFIFVRVDLEMMSISKRSEQDTIIVVLRQKWVEGRGPLSLYELLQCDFRNLFYNNYTTLRLGDGLKEKAWVAF